MHSLLSQTEVWGAFNWVCPSLEYCITEEGVMGSLAKEEEDHIPCTAPGAEDAQLVHVAGSRWQAQGELHLQAPEKSTWHRR